MRTIKFRGYSIKEKRFIYGDLLTFENCFGISETKGERNFHIVETNSIGQFTGLYDIRGEEIYEGDIVTNTDDVIETQYVVRYCDGDFVICEILNGDIEEALSRDIYESPDSDKIYSMGTFCEGWNGENYLQVVGNVYEHELKRTKK